MTHRFRPLDDAYTGDVLLLQSHMGLVYSRITENGVFCEMDID